MGGVGGEHGGDGGHLGHGGRAGGQSRGHDVVRLLRGEALDVGLGGGSAEVGGWRLEVGAGGVGGCGGVGLRLHGVGYDGGGLGCGGSRGDRGLGVGLKGGHLRAGDGGIGAAEDEERSHAGHEGHGGHHACAAHQTATAQVTLDGVEEARVGLGGVLFEVHRYTVFISIRLKCRAGGLWRARGGRGG